MNKSIAFIIPIAVLGAVALSTFFKVSSLEQELSVVTQDNARLKAELNSKSEELGRTKADLEKSIVELNNTKEELSITKDELDKSRAELSKTSKELENTLAELSITKDELDSTKVRLINTQHELDSTRMELSIAKEELDNTRVELNRVRQQYNIINERVKELEEELQGYTYREDKGDLIASYAKGYEDYKMLIDPIIASINNRFKFPYDIPVDIYSCSDVNYAAYAEYYVNSGKVSRIGFCVESIDIMKQNIDYLYNKGIINNKDSALRVYTKFILYHELGHTLIRIADINTGSREESLVDDFAFYMLVNDKDDVSALLALYKELAMLEKEGSIKMNDPSSLYLNNQQQYYDLSCLAYGADIKSQYIKLGERDKDKCTVIWYEVSKGWSKALTLWTKEI